jgi:hypothetical protein
MRISTVLALLACMSVGCAPQAVTIAPPITTAASDPIPSLETANGVALEAQPPGRRCRLTVTDTEGCASVDVETLLEPVRPRLERCHGPVGGKLRVRVRRGAMGKLSFDLQPGSSLDPTERRCLLDALATLDVDESAPAWTGLNVRPTGFTSLITIEW